VSTWISVWFVVALVTTAALLVCAIALVRHVILIGRTARRMQQETQPLLEDLSRGTQQASRHASELRPPGRS
jgi:hypothetical protein